MDGVRRWPASCVARVRVVAPFRGLRLTAALPRVRAPAAPVPAQLDRLGATWSNARLDMERQVLETHLARLGDTPAAAPTVRL